MADWLKIKTEYITAKEQISYRKLAEKYNVSFNTLKDKAKKDSWNIKRDKAHHRITTEVQRVVEKNTTNQIVKDIISIDAISDILIGKIAFLAEGNEITASSVKHLTTALKDLHSIQQGNSLRVEMTQRHDLSNLSTEELKELIKSEG